MATGETFDTTPSHLEIAQRALRDHPEACFEVVLTMYNYFATDCAAPEMRLCYLGKPDSVQTLRLALRHMKMAVDKNPWFGVFFTPADAVHIKFCRALADMVPLYPLKYLWKLQFCRRFGRTDPSMPTDLWFIQVVPTASTSPHPLAERDYMVGQHICVRPVGKPDCAIYTLPLRTSSF